MPQQVGSIFYDVTLETGGMLAKQREVSAAAKAAADSLEKIGVSGASAGAAASKGLGSAKDAAVGAGKAVKETGSTAQEASGKFVNLKADATGAAGGLREVGNESSGLRPKLSAVAAAVAVLGIAMAALKAAEAADDIRLMAAKIEVAAGSVESGTAALAALISMSRDTQTSVAANVEVFTRLNQSLLQMGGTQADTLRLTELLGKAIKVSGASAVEAKSAMLQFGQALGSGKLAGDELRSLLENAPYLMRQLADGIGVPIGSLKKMGEEGKLTADVVVNAMSKAAATIEADFSKFPQTVAGAIAVATDAAGRANEKFDELTGTSTALTGITQGMGEVFDKLADQLAGANTEAGKLEKNAHIKGWADQSKVAISYLVDAVDVVWQTVSVLGRNVAYVFQGVGTTIGGIGAQVRAVLKGDFAGAKAINDAIISDNDARRKELDAKDKATLSRTKLAGQEMRAAWEAGAGGGRGKINNTGNKQSTIKAAGNLGEWMEKYADKAEKLNAELKKAKAELGDKFTPELEQKIRAKFMPDKKAKAPKKSADERFDDTDYLANLKKSTVDGYAEIAVLETKALYDNDKRLANKQISESTHQQAITLIQAGAEEKRMDFRLTKMRESNTEAENIRKQDIALEQAKAQHIEQIIKAVNPVEALRMEYEAKLAIVTEYEALMAEAGVLSTEQSQAARMAIENQYQLQRTALAEQTFRSQSEANAFLIDSVNALSSTATSSIVGLINGTMSAQDAMRSLAGVVLNEAVSALVQIGVQQVKNALLGNTLAAADAARKAANGAVYSASVAAQVAGMSAMAGQNAFAATAAIPIIGPGLAPAAAAAAMAVSAGLGAPAIATAPLAGARQYGGPANAGNLYRVNEKGPEMFVAANGSQYLMPTQSGRVTAADQVGGGAVQWTIIVNNTAGGTTASASVDDQSKTVNIAIAQVAAQIRENSGAVWSALRGASNVQSRMG